MEDSICKIERLANGFEVTVADPKIVAANKNRDSGPSKTYTPWKDPKVSYAFTTVDDVLAFLKSNLEKALPMNDEYGSSFDAACTESDDDD